MTSFAAICALLLSVIVASCTFEGEKDPISCTLDGIWCNCTGLHNGSVADLNDSARQCNELRAEVDSGTESN